MEGFANSHDINRITLVSATRFSEEEFWSCSALGQSLSRKDCQDEGITLDIHFLNSKGLPDIYNHAIERSKGDVLVFVHDDVWIDDPRFFDEIRKGLDEFDIIGVAGNRRCLPQQPSWAFIDAEFTWDSPEYLSGAVAHGQTSHGSVTRYGSTPARCELLDGVLLAARRSALVDNDVRFDPQFEFHFYDLDFCRSASSKGLKLGTWNIRITHQSGGAFGSPGWREMYSLYLSKWDSAGLKSAPASQRQSRAKKFPQDFENMDGVWVPKGASDNISYSDGKLAEDYLLEVIEKSSDVSSTSVELQASIRDWSSRYHLSAKRGNLFRALELRPGARILELGSGCGAITRYLGEQNVTVTAVEGSHSRAMITRARCRDLDNVEVVSGNFDDLVFNHKFDVVTLIGVLEYSHLFCRAGESDPFSYVLRSAWDHLEEDGVLVIAIENKLGIKYLAGCGEDHFGRQFVGVEGYPDDEGARTFGRSELLELVTRCGFQDSQLLLPFPDYKMPTTLINAESCGAKEAIELNLVDWCRQNFEDYVNRRDHYFQEHLALESMAANGLLADFANSFLLVASKKPLTGISPVSPVKWLAKKFNVTRAPAFRTITTLRKGDNGHVIAKRLMSDTEAAPEAEFTLDPADEARYIENGRSVSFELLRALRVTRNAKEKYTAVISSWVEYLLEKANTTPSGYKLPGRYLDCIPNNLIRDSSGKLHYIDAEWCWHEPVSVEWILFRGLQVFWTEYRYWIEKALFHGSYTFKDFVDLSLKGSGTVLTHDQLTTAAEYESRFESTVIGRTLDPHFGGLLRSSFGGGSEKPESDLGEIYPAWIARHGLREIDGQIFAERMMFQWRYRPVFHFVLFLFPGDEALLGDTLDSLSEQFYQDWRLSVIADSPTPDPLWEEIESLQWLQCGVEDDPYVLVNKAIASVQSDWVSFVEPGTRWPRHALLRVGDYVNLNADWAFLYCDVDEIDNDGERGNPRFLPEVNLDMLRSMPYCREGAWVGREALLAVGGFEPLPGCEMVDLAFKMIEKKGEKSVGHIADVLTHAPKGRREPDEAMIALTVKNHLERSGVAAVVGEGYLPRTLRVNYLHAEEAFVTIIIPTRDKYEYINSCIQSLSQRTAYDNFEVIIADMGSTDPDTLALYESVEKSDEGRISVLRLGPDVNVAGACNYASKMARGEYLLFLKNHVEAKQEQWLSRLMLHAQRSEVGVVGPRVVSPESTLLFDAGLVLGMDDVVGKPFASRLKLNDAGYMGRAQIDQNYSAVSDTCLVVRKSLFTELGGMDAEGLGKNFLDVDLCLRVGQAGYKVVWTPFSLLMAYEGSATINERGKGREYLEDVVAFEKAREVLLERWLPQIANDPAYNPNLDLSSDNAFVVNDKLPLNWDINFHERTRVLGLPLNGGSGDYRIIQPFDAISDAALQQTEHYRVVKGMGAQLKMAPIVRMDPDVLVVQAGIDDMHVNLLEDLARHKPDIFRVFSLDDLVTEIPEKSSVYKHYTGNFRNARARIRKALSLCDRMIVTTHTLADAYADMIDDIRVIPNRLRRDPWLSLKSRRRVGKKPRVGWVGAQQHAGDLDLIIDVVKQTADKVDWVFMGMCPQEIRPIVAEYDTQWVAYDKYPAKMAALNLDIAVAPLEQHRFNEAKSNLRLLEYGILGWPVVCTDIAPYQSYDAPVRSVANETDAWIGAIMDYANDLDRAAKDGDKLRDWVKRNFILEDHLDEWVNALTPTHHSRDVGESDAFAQGAPVGVPGNSGEADLIPG